MLLTDNFQQYLGHSKIAANNQLVSDEIKQNGVWSDPTKPLGQDLTVDPQIDSESDIKAYDYDTIPNPSRYIYTIWIPYYCTLPSILGLKLSYPYDINQ